MIFRGAIYLVNRGANSLSFSTVEDAALYLGITPSHLYKLVRKYDIPHSRPTNGRIFFNKEDLDRWVKSRMDIETETALINETEPQHECYY